MKKLILIIVLSVVVLILLILGYGYFVMSKEAKYALKLNFLTEKGLRNEIEKSMFYEGSKESCELNKYQGFNSMKDCQKAVGCISSDFSALVLKADLKQLAKDMDQGKNGESAVNLYLGSHQAIADSLKAKLGGCLAGSEYSVE